MTDVMASLGVRAESFTAFEIGIIHFMESQRLGSNPYEPGFLEYDQFTEGWAAAKEGQVDIRLPSLQSRYQDALNDQLKPNDRNWGTE